MLHLLDRGLTVVCVAAAALVIVLLFAGPSLVGAKTKTPHATSAASGAQVFQSAGCGACHTLKAAGASGTIGPNLDQLRADAANVASIVRTGAAPMPSYAGRLSYQQITAVANYVSSVAGR
jgi:mono/diheme cytochrome c family protein